MNKTDDVRGIYLYCVLQTSVPLVINSNGLHNGPVRALTYRDLTAVVSDLPCPELKPSRELVIAHERVIAQLMREHPVIPMRFGITTGRESQIEMMLVDNYALLKRTLAQVRDHVELGLKVLWRREAYAPDIGGSDLRLRHRKTDLANKYAAIPYDEACLLGQLVAEVANHKRQEYQKRIYEPLQELAAAAALNDILTERMVFNAAFLVFKNNLTAFDQLVHELCVRYADILEFRYSGPWPPYNFCLLPIKLG